MLELCQGKPNLTYRNSFFFTENNVHGLSVFSFFLSPTFNWSEQAQSENYKETNFFETVDKIISYVSGIITCIVLNSIMIVTRQFSK